MAGDAGAPAASPVERWSGSSAAPAHRRRPRTVPGQGVREVCAIRNSGPRRSGRRTARWPAVWCGWSAPPGASTGPVVNASSAVATPAETEPCRRAPRSAAAASSALVTSPRNRVLDDSSGRRMRRCRCTGQGIEKFSPVAMNAVALRDEELDRHRGRGAVPVQVLRMDQPRRPARRFVERCPADSRRRAHRSPPPRT